MRSLTKTDAAFEEIRRRIYSGKFRPGQRLPVSELVQLLDMSPTPIREALRMLQSEGLVVHSAHHGVIVRTASGEQDEDVFDLRFALEPIAAEKAARGASSEQIVVIERLYQRLRALAEQPARHKGALQRIKEAHADLFRAIFAASNHAMLIDFISQARASMPRDRPLHQWEETLDEQAELVAAVCARAPARARKAMGAYLSHIRKLDEELASKISEPQA